MDQVVRDIDPVKCLEESVARDGVTLHDRDVERDAGGLARETADRMAVAQQARHDGGADVPGDAGHEDVHPGAVPHGAGWTKVRSSRSVSGAPASWSAFLSSPITISSTR